MAAGSNIYPVKDNTTLIKGITSSSAPMGIECRGEITSGSPFTEKRSIVKVAPSHVFDSMDVAAVLTVLGAPTTFWKRIAGAGYFFYAYFHAQGGTRLGSTAHKQYLFRDGILFPTKISVSQDGFATISVQAIAVYDGTNEIVTFTESVTLPTATGDKAAFKLGPVVVGDGVGTVTLTKLTNLELDFGIQPFAEFSDGDVRPRDISIMSIDPKITLSGINVQWVKDTAGIPLLGKKSLHANTKIYLRKRDPDGGIDILNATAEHISITATGLVYCSQMLNGAMGQLNTCELVIETQHDATNLPVVINPATAIT